MDDFSFGHKVLHKITLKKFSLQKQLIIIFSTLLMLIIVLLMPLIDRNLGNIVDQEMFDELRNGQSVYIDYGNLPASKIAAKQIYHLEYTRETELLTVDLGVLSKLDADDLLHNVFGEDLEMMVTEGKDIFEGKSSYQGSVIYYRIASIKNGKYIISLAYEEYYNSLIDNFKQQVVYVIYIAILGIAGILYIWILTLIEPLKLIRNYIKDIKEDKSSNLRIDRNDEIGIVSNALVDMKENLDAQSKVKEEMIHNISHDLKTPISLIQTYAQSIKDGIYPYGDKESSMDVIIENAERLEKKVYSLLYLNRLDYLRDRKSEEDVSMKGLIEHSISQMVTMHPEIVVELHLEDITFRGNEEYWRTCIENIVENAYRYVKSKIIFTLKQEYLEIYNDGETIELEYIDSLFKPYEKGVKGQFGLGLSIVYKTVTMYDYTVYAENKDIGVSFIIKKK